MDAALRGHAYAKAAVDIACWDLLGRAPATPVSTLLGGVRAEDFPLYVAIPLGPVDEMVAHVRARHAEGVRRFQLKLGADPREDAARVRAVLDATGDDELVIADANGGWRLHDATVAARALEGLDRVLFEQPCPTLEECLIVRERTTLPMVLDEVIVDVQSLVRAYGAIEAVNLKLGRVGGLTAAKRLRDLGVELGLRFTIEDSLGRRSHDRRRSPPRRLHAAGRAADGVVHERLDARPHRRPPAALVPRPRQRPGRPRPRDRRRPRGARRAAAQRSHRRLTASSSDCRIARCASGSTPSASTNVNVSWLPSPLGTTRVNRPRRAFGFER